MLHEGIVIAINGTNPGPASGISYNIAVDLEGAEVVFQDMVPFGARLPDDLDTVAAPVGTPIVVSDRGGNIRLLPPGESFQIEVCEEPEP
jgi:hypothetical protein